jgi:transposase-like protein
MKKIASASLSQGFRFPPEILRHGVWLSFRFSLSFRAIEELLAERGVVLPDETLWQWCLKFGPTSANELKHRRGKTDDNWPLDEVFLKMNGKAFSLWRAVDQHGVTVQNPRLVEPARPPRFAPRRCVGLPVERCRYMVI